jgi:hypothetical protein
MQCPFFYCYPFFKGGMNEARPHMKEKTLLLLLFFFTIFRLLNGASSSLHFEKYGHEFWHHIGFIPCW